MSSRAPILLLLLASAPGWASERPPEPRPSPSAEPQAQAQEPGIAADADDEEERPFHGAGTSNAMDGARASGPGGYASGPELPDG